MQGASWISLFERIPAKYHDSLVLTMVTGAEIMLHSVLRLEDDFAIIRGRMAGSTDAARVIVMPYDQIVNVAFLKAMLETEVQTVFGSVMQAPATRPAAETPTDEAVRSESAEAAEEDASPEPEESPMRTIVTRGPAGAAANAAAGKSQVQAPSKSILLARLRARLAEQGK